MAKKSKKVEKETRKVMEAFSNLVKKKGDRYKFKSGHKKQVKKIKKHCVHWIIRKGKEVPLVRVDMTDPTKWHCICGHSFPIKPDKPENYNKRVCDIMEDIDQMLFWSVKLGGDANDTKMFLRLKEDIPRFQKVQKQILKQINKREAWENNRKNSDSLQRFDSFAGFNYK